MIKKPGHIALAVCMLLIAWFSSCKPKQICPAYQSAFYLDKKIADEEFSPFDKDSMPKMEETVRKTDVLLVLRLGKKKIDKRMAIIPMITIFPEIADSTLAMADSLAADSAAVEEEPEVGEEEIADSTGTEELTPGESDKESPEPEPDDPFREEEPEQPKKEVEKPKPAKKLDPRDPELSDPGLKAEFEESFEEAPTDEDLNEPLQEYEEPPPKQPRKKKPVKKGPKKAEPDKPKEPEPAAEDDKF